jgi:hypothetical protein
MEDFARLHRAGWLIGDAAFAAEPGCRTPWYDTRESGF